MGNARDIIAAARIRVVTKEPYLSSVLFSLRLREEPSIETAGVSADLVLGYNPAFVETMTPVQFATIVAHEVHHVLRDHSGRRGMRDHKVFNVSGDAEINDDLKAAGWSLPGTPVTPGALGLPDGLLAEEYYDRIAKQGEDAPKPEPGKTPGSGGDCGGCAGNPAPWEEKVEDGAGAGERRVLRRQVAEAVKEAAGKSRGTVPAGLAKWAEAALRPPQVPWQQVLRARIRAAIASHSGADDYTRSRIARRYWGARAIFGDRTPLLPAIRGHKPVVSVVLDTSGSMDGGPLETALAEVLGIVQATGAPVKAYSCNAAVAAVRRVSGKRDVMELNGADGGTDMRVGIEQAAKDRPDVIVVLTDAYTPWPAPSEMPRAKVIAAVVGEMRVPDHITTVRVPDGEGSSR